MAKLQIVLHFRYRRKVSKYTTKGNKPEIPVDDIQKAVEAVRKNEKKLR